MLHPDKFDIARICIMIGALIYAMIFVIKLVRHAFQ